MKKDSYVCAICKQEFEKGWTDEEAIEEKNILFGQDKLLEDCGIICDDCFKRFIEPNMVDDE